MESASRPGWSPGLKVLAAAIEATPPATRTTAPTDINQKVRVLRSLSASELSSLFIVGLRSVRQ